MSAGLRIFSYLPNPRIAKATIAARLCGVEVELRGAAVAELSGWLWDYDARPLDAEAQVQFAHLTHHGKTGFSAPLFKTPQFLRAHPFGTVPAAFGPGGDIGIFESNSIMRAVARLREGKHGLYGQDAYSASRIDSFLDVSLVFARDVQLYVLALRDGSIANPLHASAGRALRAYLGGIEQALQASCAHIAGDELSLADITYAAELALLHNENLHHPLLARGHLPPLLGDGLRQAFPLAWSHFDALIAHPAFAPDLGPYLDELKAG